MACPVSNVILPVITNSFESSKKFNDQHNAAVWVGLLFAQLGIIDTELGAAKSRMLLG